MNMKKNSKTLTGRDTTVDRILDAYNTISQSIRASQLDSINLTNSQVKVLASFFQKSVFTMTELSRAHSVRISTMTSMVDRLIQSGYLERERDAHDRRIVQVCLTANGKRTVKELMSVRRKALSKFLDRLSDEEKIQFLGSIENVAHFLSRKEEEKEQKA